MGARTTTVSIANLARDEWTITNTDHPEVTTVALWLDEALQQHRAQLAAVTTARVTIRYQLDGEDVDDEVCRVRRTVERLQKEYRNLQSRDVLSRPERYTLLERLSQSRVMPSEMATMLGVDLHLAERFAGDDQEARIARTLFHHLNELRGSDRQEAHA